MALIQSDVIGIAAQLGEEKATIDEIVQQAEESAAAADAAAKTANLGRITVVVGGLTNLTKEPLSVMKEHKYAGHIWKNFPNPLNKVGGFAISAASDKGVMAAVVYSGKNNAGEAFGWLLAFADTKTTGRRVYAECGPLYKFNEINWEKVRDKLERAGAVVTLSNIKATIVGTSSKTVVAAVFRG